MEFKILTSQLLDDFTKKVSESPLDKLDRIEKVEMPVDYFQFYKSVSSVYSSKIEGEDIDFDSFFKHKFLNVKFKSDYTRKADDLYSAYDFIDNNELDLKIGEGLKEDVIKIDDKTDYMIPGTIIWGAISINSFILALLFICLSLLQNIVSKNTCFIILGFAVCFIIFVNIYLIRKRNK